MKAFGNWENVQAAKEREQLPKGGYVVRIMDAAIREFQGQRGSFERFEVSVDIAEGEYKDFYAQDYRAQSGEDKRWRGVLRMYLPKEDGSKEDERTKSYFKTMVEAIEDSNTGYHWDWNEKGLKGKVVGCLVRAEEWEMNGRNGWCTKPFRFVPIADIRENRFKVPKDKPLRHDATSKAAVNSAAAVEEILPIDDLPF